MDITLMAMTMGLMWVKKRTDILSSRESLLDDRSYLFKSAGDAIR